jgi:hypothetical protein
MRQIVFAIALLFMGLLAVLTVFDAIDNGINALDAVSILVLALFATGVIGALRHPPPE